MRHPRSPLRVALLASAVLLVLSGCGPELGPGCDTDEARRVVYDLQGNPAFEGQALMIASCGSGGFCHSPEAEGEARRGVPVGLDYDLRIASISESLEQDETDRLRENHRRAYIDRYAIWHQVVTGRMPIPGAAGEEILEGATEYTTLDLQTRERRPMPTLAEESGREILRNWLQCDLPIIERAEAPVLDDPDMDPPPPFGFIVPTQEDPLEPNWTDIYDRLIGPRCATSACHDETTSAVGLNLEGREQALSALLAASASTDEDADCMGHSGGLLTPMNADASLLVHKLSGLDEAGEAVCGDRMPPSGAPLSDPSLAAIRTWINAGAMP